MLDIISYRVKLYVTRCLTQRVKINSHPLPLELCCMAEQPIYTLRSTFTILSTNAGIRYIDTSQYTKKHQLINIITNDFCMPCRY